MLCSQMIANQNLAWTTALDLTSPFFFDASRTANHNPRVFCHLRTLFALVSHEIARNSSRINHLRTLAKTTAGCRPEDGFGSSSSTFDFNDAALFSAAWPLLSGSQLSTVDGQLAFTFFGEKRWLAISRSTPSLALRDREQKTLPSGCTPAVPRKPSACS